MAEHKNIGEAKLAIMQEVPYIRKVKGKDLPYSYATERDFIRRVRPAMVAHQVTVSSSPVDVVHNSTVSTSGGKVMVMRCITITYRFTHVPSGTYEDVGVAADGVDMMDKASSKAMTQAMKWALRQWLMIETGDEPETLADLDGLHLSESAEKAREAILHAKDQAALDVIAKKIAGSANISAAERAWLMDPLEERRSELMSLDDMTEGDNGD